MMYNDKNKLYASISTIVFSKVLLVSITETRDRFGSSLNGKPDVPYILFANDMALLSIVWNRHVQDEVNLDVIIKWTIAYCTNRVYSVRVTNVKSVDIGYYIVFAFMSFKTILHTKQFTYFI